MLNVDEIWSMDTPIIHPEVLSREYGANVSVFDGSAFPTGTIKDVIYSLLLSRDIWLDEVVYAVISWGNAARSLAVLAQSIEQSTGMRRIAATIIPSGYHGLRRDLEADGAVVIEKSIRALEREINDSELKQIVIDELNRQGVRWSGNPSNIVNADTVELRNNSYAPLIEGFSKNIDYVFVPFGSGRTAKEIIHELIRQRGSSIPTFVCVEVEGKSVLRGKNITWDKTLTAYSTFRPDLEELAKQYPGKIQFMEVSERERDEEYTFLNREGINAEPAAALAFAGARKYKFPTPDANALIVNTGKGRIYERQSALSAMAHSYLARVAAALLVSAGLYAGFCTKVYERQPLDPAIATYLRSTGDSNDLMIARGISRF